LLGDRIESEAKYDVVVIRGTGEQVRRQTLRDFVGADWVTPSSGGLDQTHHG
jgi:hypothetical protein